MVFALNQSKNHTSNKGKIIILQGNPHAATIAFCIILYLKSFPLQLHKISLQFAKSCIMFWAKIENFKLHLLVYLAVKIRDSKSWTLSGPWYCQILKIVYVWMFDIVGHPVVQLYYLTYEITRNGHTYPIFSDRLLKQWASLMNN